MNLTQDEILQLLRLLDESPFDELSLETGGLKLSIIRRGSGASTEARRLRRTAHSTAEEERVEVAPTGAAPPGRTGQSAQTRPAEEAGGALLEVRAPVLGTFYRRPSPKDPPFVEVGTRVATSDTVCLLEIMKVFNTVKAGVEGTIEEICAADGDLVEFG